MATLRIVMLTDPHGNLTALSAALDAARDLAPDFTVCGGDVAQFGPQPNECIGLLAEAGIPCVRGNHDRDLLSPLVLPPNASARQQGLVAIHNWGHAQLSAASRAYLAGLPFDWRAEPAPGQALLVVHASPDRDDEIVEEAEGLGHCERAGAAAVVAGHLHRAFVIGDGARLWVNAGSCGGTSDGDPRASLAVLDWRGGRWEVRILRVEYDLDRVDQAYRQSGMPFAVGVAAARRKGALFSPED